MIEFRNVSKAFDEDVVLKSVSFKIARGETKIILGASGSGKSTILKLILGLIRPDEGQIIIEGEDITLDERARSRSCPQKNRHGVPGGRAVRFPFRAGKRRVSVCLKNRTWARRRSS